MRTTEDSNGIDFLQRHMQENEDQKTGELPYIDLASISEATNNFSESNKLGQGGFGPVYKVKIALLSGNDLKRFHQ